MKRAHMRFMKWLFSDLDADLLRIRGVVLGQKASSVSVCDDQELRMYRGRRAPEGVAFQTSPWP